METNTMTKREKMALTNLDMSKPLGWRQRMLLIAIRDLSRSGNFTTTKNVIDYVAHRVDEYATPDSDLDDVNWYLNWSDKGESVSNLYFYKDCYDTLCTMRNRHWIGNIIGYWKIMSKFTYKVMDVHYEPFTIKHHEYRY